MPRRTRYDLNRLLFEGLDQSGVTSNGAGHQVSVRSERLGIESGPSTPPLTGRQLQVLCAVIQAGEEGAARELGISLHTVKNHIRLMREKFEANNQAHLVWLLWRYYGDAFSRLKVSDHPGRERRRGWDRRKPS